MTLKHTKVIKVELEVGRSEVETPSWLVGPPRVAHPGPQAPPLRPAPHSTLKFFLRALNVVGALATIFTTTSCASYHLGNYKRAVPGGYDRVAIPIFTNKTQEVGIETYFTESLRTEFERSRLAKVTSTNDAQVILEGTIVSVQFIPTATIANSSTVLTTPNVVPYPGNPAQVNPLPDNTLLATQYSANVTVRIKARKVSDNSILWNGEFAGQRIYQAPMIGSPILNTVDPIYNQNSRVDTVSRLAQDLMSEAHDRLTENF